MLKITKIEDITPVDNREVIERYLELARGGYTREQLERGFDLVKPVTHWKDRIDAVIEADDRDLVRHAVPYYCGGPEPVFTEQADGRLHVAHNGYWIHIGS